jgi:hypothetical protein
MPTEPKTWTENEIVLLIENEIRECQASANKVDRTAKGMAENIYSVLIYHNLIEHTP